MQLILITRSDKPHLSIRLMGWRLWIALGIVAAIILTAMRIGMALNTESGSLTKSVIEWWEETREDSLAKELGGEFNTDEVKQKLIKNLGILFEAHWDAT